MKLKYYFLIGAIAFSAAVVSIRESETGINAPRPGAQADSKVPDGWRVGATQSTLTKQLGLQPGDIILRINGNEFSGSREDFGKVRAHCEAGRSVSVEYWREGSVQTASKAINLSLADTDRIEFGAYVLSPPLESSDSSTRK